MAPLSHRIATFEVARAEVRSRGVQHLILALLPASWPLQKCRKRNDHSLNKFSGLRPVRQDAACACLLCSTAQTGLRSQNPWVCIGFRDAVPGPPKMPPKRLPGARPPKPPGQAPPRGRKCVCYCVLHSKLASGLKNLRFFNGFRAPKRPQVRFLLCFTDQTCLRSYKLKVFQWF